MTPRLRPACFLLVALLLASGPAAADPAALFTDGRVVLAPLNLGIRAEPEIVPGSEPVWQELVGYLGAQDAPKPASLAPEGAQALWAEVLAATPSDTEPDVYDSYARFARSLAEQVEFGALVIPALVVRAAQIDGHRAAWDGVRRTVEMPLPDQPFPMEVGAVRGQSRGGRGAMRAASLHVAVLGPDGELRFEGAGGLALLQRLERREGASGPEVALADAREPFTDAEALREGVRAAFERPLPASSAADAR